MTPMTYRVSGMSCEGCATAVINAIQAVEASAEVDVDLEAGTVRVDGVGGPAVAEAVEAAGFEFEGALAP